MPFVTINSRKKRTPGEKHLISDAIQGALVSIGVPPTDRFHRFFELEPEDFIFDTSYPDLQTPRSDAFMLIQVVFSVGRSVKVKRQFLDALMNSFKTTGIEPNDVMVVFQEVSWENWAFSGGKILHV
jgi:phenylpyruvate tautomerase PptA (4-oxalocrotonate tautomerase family)